MINNKPTNKKKRKEKNKTRPGDFLQSITRASEEIQKTRKKSKISSAAMETSGEINEVTSFQGLAIFFAAGRQELLSAASLRHDIYLINSWPFLMHRPQELPSDADHSYSAMSASLGKMSSAILVRYLLCGRCSTCESEGQGEASHISLVFWHI